MKNNLKNLREQAGLTPEAISEKTGLTLAEIASIENFKPGVNVIKPVSKGKRKKYLRAINFNPEQDPLFLFEKKDFKPGMNTPKGKKMVKAVTLLVQSLVATGAIEATDLTVKAAKPERTNK